MEKDYKVEFYTSDGGMTGALRIVPFAGEVREITVDDLLEAVNAEGITCGVDREVLEKVARERTTDQWVVFARGVRPQAGSDGEVKFHFEKERPRALIKEDPTGKVNLRDLNLIQNVKKGDILCELVPPQPGRKGVTVRNEEVPGKDGAPAKLPGGTNVSLSADRTQMFAAMDGLVRWAENMVIVEPVYTVHDVDASVGNIRFNGSVVVQGEVGDGYEIHAGKDITIGTSVGRVILEAGGDIRITGGILGQETALVTANGDIRVRFIQDAHVKSEKNIVVGDYIRNSLVSATGAVVVKNPKGFIVSSKVSSDTWIYCNTVGQEDGGGTSELSIGHSPVLHQEQTRIREEIEAKAQDFLRLHSSLVKLRAIKATSELTRQQEMLYERILEAMDTLRRNLIQQNARVIEIDEKMNRTIQGNIYTEGRAYPGTTIRIGMASLTLACLMEGVHFHMKDGQVACGGFVLAPEVKKVLEERE